MEVDSEPEEGEEIGFDDDGIDDGASTPIAGMDEGIDGSGDDPLAADELDAAVASALGPLAPDEDAAPLGAEDSDHGSSEPDVDVPAILAAGGDEAPPPLPPPMLPPAPDAEIDDMREVGHHDQIRVNEWCTITWYTLRDRRDFIAVCKHPGHYDCVLTRTAKGSPWEGRAGQGRPLGYLVAWCMACDSGAPDKAAHNKIGQELRKAPGFEQRDAARAWFYLHERGQAFMAKERPRREGESEEPPYIP